MYVYTKIKEAIEPISTLLEPMQEKVTESYSSVKDFTKELENYDLHYKTICRAICATQGLVLKDVTAHEIQSQFVKHLARAQSMR